MSQQSSDSERWEGGWYQNNHGHSPADDLRRAEALVQRACSAIEEPDPAVASRVATITTLIQTLDPTTAVDTRYHQSRGRGAVETLETLGDPECREILSATRESPMTVAEIETNCGIPCSTAYRKLDRLTAASLLDTSVRIGSDGPHATEYQPAVTDILVEFDPDPLLTHWQRPSRRPADEQQSLLSMGSPRATHRE